MRNEIRNSPYSNVHFMYNPIGDIGDTDSVVLPLTFSILLFLQCDVMHLVATLVEHVVDNNICYQVYCVFLI